jgi:parallel beta-helix repeat protein
VLLAYLVLNNAYSSRRRVEVGKRALALLLFLGALGASDGPTAVAASPSTYYVSPSGSDNVGLGTQGSPWRTIGHAVALAASADIIKVMDDDNEATDDYVENVVVDKSLTIERHDDNGANPQVKALDANKPVLDISADSVTVRGLDIYGTAESMIHGIRLLFCTGCTIDSNRLGWDSNHSNGCGIGISGGRDNRVSGNTCRYFSIAGVFVTNSHSNTISNNTFSNHRYTQGVSVWLQDSTSNTIVGNTISRNMSAGIGMAGGAEGNVIYLNRLSDNLGGNMSQTSAGSNTWHSAAKVIYTYKGGTYTGYLGNYYGDYTGVDDGTDGRLAGDGVGDTHLPYSGNNADDDYPLVDGSADAYYIVCSLPVANFSASDTSGVAPLTVLFTDRSKGDDITSWLWEFGDGQTIAERNPSHIYETLGVYTVSLKVANACGSDFVTEENYIYVLQMVSPYASSTVEAAEGTITLVFPAGAVTGDSSILIKQLSKDYAAPAPSGFSSGDTYFSVEGVDTLEKKVAICVKYNDADLAAADGDVDRLVLAYWDEAAGEWKAVKTSVNRADMTLNTSTTHLGTWALLVKTTSGSNGMPTWLWAVVGVAGVLVIGSGIYLATKRKAGH